jgi:SAM-dependent methyltransferase
MKNLTAKNLKASLEINPRLFPSRANSSYYVLTKIREELKNITEQYLNNRNDLVLVDCGCGSKPYSSIFKGYISRYVGIDLAGNKDADAYVSSDGRIDLPDNYADIVLSTQVLEHVEDPNQYLCECHRLLKEGGLLILSTHGYWVYHPSPVDYWRWTGSGLQKTIKKSDFEIDKIVGIMGVMPAAFQLLQDIILVRLWIFLRPSFSFFMQALITLSDKLHTESSRQRDACVFFVVAKKQTSAIH